MRGTLTLDVLAPCARATSVAAPPSSLGIWRTCGAIARHGRMGFVGVFFSPGSGPTVTDEPRKQTFAHLEDAAGGRAPARVAREVGLMIPVEGRAVVEVRVVRSRTRASVAPGRVTTKEPDAAHAQRATSSCAASGSPPGTSRNADVTTRPRSRTMSAGRGTAPRYSPIRSVSTEPFARKTPNRDLQFVSSSKSYSTCALI